MPARCLVVLLLTISACVMPTPGTSGLLVTADGPWTPPELAELQAACDAWDAFTNGRIACTVTKAAGGDVRAIRAPTGTSNPAHLNYRDRTATIDPDAYAREGRSLRQGVGAAARHMIGLAFRVPLHPGPGVMSSGDTIDAEFTPADYPPP